MNHPQYQQRQIHPNNRERLYDMPTDDEMKPFKTSELLKKQKPIENLSNNDLIEYCHNEWKLWMASMLELQKCIEKEKNDIPVTRNQQDKKAVFLQQNNNDPMMNFRQPNEHNLPNPNMMYPPFYQPSYQEFMRAQNMQFMRNNQPQSRPSYMPQNVGNSSFPFPFSQQQMQMAQGGHGQGFTPAQTYGGRGPMMGNQMKK